MADVESLELDDPVGVMLVADIGEDDDVGDLAASWKPGESRTKTSPCASSSHSAK